MIPTIPTLEPPRRRDRNRGPLVLVVALVVLALGGFVALVQALDGDVNAVQPIAPSPEQATVIAESSQWIAAPSSTSRPLTTSVPADPSRFDYAPLWPFASVSDAQRWQQDYAASGHQPWHLDARQVALNFTEHQLGFTNVDTVLRVRLWTSQAWVTVGFTNPNGAPVTSAELHLVRIGAGDEAPWEVVGTQDTTLTITTPLYGVKVSSPVTVGGLLSGVDESLRVEVRTLFDPHPVGVVSGISAGGDMSPWSATVPFAVSPGRTLTVVVSTGGHIAPVERFAITGVSY
ncbi:hypothetical protein [Smaragdicoccus niigatensis]|uniref:hypothetical protein n=1 Tax=Smaragdicoccus niigatensis TaxID=359359 RepID=UPI0003A89EE5|nr:hypothetical protein [Smaragdicoccus niigatensis]